MGGGTWFRFKKSNRYTAWYYGPKASFGWCGAYTSFALGEAGLPQAVTNTFRQITPLPDGQPYGIREAGVPKLLTGYTNMDRIINVPGRATWPSTGTGEYTRPSTSAWLHA